MNEEHASTDITSKTKKIELPKLLIDNCNYEQLKKLSFQKLNELTKNSLISTELNKSKSLNNLASNVASNNVSNDVSTVVFSPSDCKEEIKQNDELIENLKKGMCIYS